MEARAADGNRIQGLAELIAAQAATGPAPVDSWNPPYRGDIGLAIRADGTWVYQGSPITRQRLVRLFARVLRRGNDGRHYLVTPTESVDVAVADAPFLAVEMEVHGSGCGQQLIFRTNVDDIVQCGRDHPLRFEQQAATGGLKPYLRVRGRLDALITRAVCYDLFELAQPDLNDTQTLHLWSGGVRFVVGANQ